MVQPVEEIIAIAGDRKPAEADAEEHDQDDAEPEGRQAEADGREQPDRLIRRPPAPAAASEPSRTAISTARMTA
jgi:hypothetical protein